MRPDKQPDDIHSIMSRFTSWAGKQAGSGLAGAGEGVREVPYEEAMERLRSRRRKAPGQVATGAHAADSVKSAGGGAPGEPAAIASAPIVEERVVAETTPASPEARAAKRIRPARASARAKAAAAKGNVAAGRSAGKQGSQAKTKEFRQVLAKSVASRGSGAPGKAAKTIERDQRVSVRLSVEEERQLQQRAAEAGITVSQYLRQCALPGKAAPGKSAGIFAEDSFARPNVPPAAGTEKPSGFGEWITLLRNRFLSSPARFAERA